MTEELEQPQVSGFVMPSSPADRKTIRDALMEMSASMTRIEGEKDFQKETLNDLYDKFKIPKQLLSRLAKAYHKQNYVEELNKDDDFEVLVEILIKGQSTE